MEVISLIGIVIALVLIILGSLRGYSLILLSTVAALIVAVFLSTLIMSIGGINTFVIIFTMYPMAAAFFKKAGISRSLIPGCVLGGAVAMQALPGMPISNILMPAEAFGTSAMAGFWMAIVGFI